MDFPGRPERSSAAKPTDDPVEQREREFLASIAEADPETPLQIFSREREGVLVLALEGELDLYTNDQFRKEMTTALAGNPAGLVLDFSYLTYLDSGGLRQVLLAARALPKRVAVITPKERIRRLFEVTGLSTSIHLCQNLPEALLAVKAFSA